MYNLSVGTCFLFLGISLTAEKEPIFAPGAALRMEAGDGVGGEGPTWHPKLGVLCSGNGHIYRLARDGKVSTYRKDAGTNGLLFDRQGRLLACEPNRRRVTRTELDGKITLLTERFEGKRYNQPNDLTLDSQGRIYFSDPRYGDRTGMEIRDNQGRTIEGVYRINIDGQVVCILGREVERPNGLLVSADDKSLCLWQITLTIANVGHASCGVSMCARTTLTIANVGHASCGAANTYG